jgi:ABC-2 type transport system permease protein
MNIMPTLIRREFWEHRGLWIGPLVIAGLLIALSVFTSSIDIHLDNKERLAIGALSPATIFGMMIGGMMVPQLIVMLIMLSIYLLDALYTERKDRSILFWKSLPVSDAQTVWSKFATAMLATPLLVYAVSLVTSVVLYVILRLRLAGTPFADVSVWDTVTWLGMQGMLLADTLIGALWYAPLAAALLLVSAWARRSVYLWATLPPLGVMFLEWRIFGTAHFARFLSYRSNGFFQAMGRSVLPLADMPLGRAGGVYRNIDATGLLLNPDLWLGAAAAVALLWLTIRIRRSRDDT